MRSNTACDGGRGLAANGRYRAAIGVVAIVGLVLGRRLAHATVYGWKGKGGVLVLSNDPADVPADQQATAVKFTAKPAPTSATPREAPPPSSDTARGDAYRRGFDAGLEVAERQVALAEEMTRAALAAVAQSSAPVVIQEPPTPVAPDVASYGYPPPYGGFPGFYPPYAPYAYAFGVRAPFFPRSRGRFVGRRFFASARGPFFPHDRFARSRFHGMR